MAYSRHVARVSRRQEATFCLVVLTGEPWPAR